ncbi:MAG: putative ABC transport system permease protein [Motiliproteus sp.]|jgi:putative ABC transport system permease protein
MTLANLSLPQLSISLIPVLIVLIILWFWGLRVGHALYALARMLLQLLLIGYALIFIFQAEASPVVLGVLTIMLLASSWIALNTVEPGQRARLFSASLLSIAIGGGLTLALITQGVLQLDPWYEPRFMIPLAGMIFANSMTGISLAADRLQVELNNGSTADQARLTAYQTSMIPVINSLLAVGLVSLPGMMTGQILSGVSPFIAARYQIMVMCMIFGSTGISTALFLYWSGRRQGVVKQRCQ